MQLIGSIKGIAGAAAGTADSLGKIGIDTLEKASGAALESWQFYHGLGLRQLRALSGATTPAAMRDLIGESASPGAEAVARLVADLQKGLTLATEMRIAVENALGSVPPPEPVATTRTQAITRSTPV